MNTKQTILFGILALFGGFIGGILSDGLPGIAVAKSDVEKITKKEGINSEVPSGELDKPYSITRKEWLEISIFKIVKDVTDVWANRIASIVWVKEEEKTIFVTLTSANGEDQLGDNAMVEYVNYVKKGIERMIEKYDWAKNLKVFVQFI